MVHRLLLAALVALLTACSSPNPSLYTLAVVPGAQQTGAPRIIELRAIGLARYLERSQIVRSSEDLRIDVLGNEWWGEPLDAMLSRILVEELTERLPNSTVFAENSAITPTPDVGVGVNILRMDTDRTGAVILLAQISTNGRNPVSRSVRFSVMPTSPGTPGLVNAMSIATGRLADAIASLVTRR